MQTFQADHRRNQFSDPIQLHRDVKLVEVYLTLVGMRLVLMLMLMGRRALPGSRFRFFTLTGFGMMLVWQQKKGNAGLLVVARNTMMMNQSNPQ
jgi:hypothetical protein